MNSIVRLCACIALASLAASPAVAAEGLYLRLGAGISHIDQDAFADADFDLGYMGSAAVGYNWFFPETVADLRIETEASFRNNDADSLGSLPLNGEATVLGAMLNGYLDFRTTWVVTPYLGFGFGAARIQYEDNGAGVTAPIDDNDITLAHQLMGGFNYDISSNLAVGVEYRYFQTGSFDLRDTNNNSFTPEYKQHSVLATITVGF